MRSFTLSLLLILTLCGFGGSAPALHPVYLVAGACETLNIDTGMFISGSSCAAMGASSTTCTDVPNGAVLVTKTNQPANKCLPAMLDSIATTTFRVRCSDPVGKILSSDWVGPAITINPTPVCS